MGNTDRDLGSLSSEKAAGEDKVEAARTEAVVLINSRRNMLFSPAYCRFRGYGDLGGEICAVMGSTIALTECGVDPKQKDTLLGTYVPSISAR
jgi:hypothetical protein